MICSTESALQSQLYRVSSVTRSQPSDMLYGEISWPNKESLKLTAEQDVLEPTQQLSKRVNMPIRLILTMYRYCMSEVHKGTKLTVVADRKYLN